jgi:hypothetical protein
MVCGAAEKEEPTQGLSIFHSVSVTTDMESIGYHVESEAGAPETSHSAPFSLAKRGEGTKWLRGCCNK